MTTTELIETRRETYGHDDRAINRHSERWYQDGDGNCYVLSRTQDGCPPFFEAYGPFPEEHEGLLPRLLIDGQAYWGDDWSWEGATAAFRRELNAEITIPKQERSEVKS